MTANQVTAIDIACKVIRGEYTESDLDDGQWALVTLASSLGHTRSGTTAVCAKVITDFKTAAGFFADVSEGVLLEWEPMLPPIPDLALVPEFSHSIHAAR
jgi:hypothetical protein